AAAGPAFLRLPRLSAPPLAGAALMALAGASWGIYSLLGRSSSNPLAQTTGNFVRSVPLMLGVTLAALPQLHVRPEGIVYAVASGALASALGYVGWYQAL